MTARLRPGLMVALIAPCLIAQTAQVRAKVSPVIPGYSITTAVKGALEVPGTDALEDLGAEWSRVFKTFHPGAQVIYNPVLTHEAVKDLIEGKRALIVAGREMTQEESAKFRVAFGYLPMRVPVCLDANIVFVNKNNPLTQITMEQLEAIYGKKPLAGTEAPVATWSDLKVRGDLGKRTINAYSRYEGATRDYLKQKVLKGAEFRESVIGKDDNASLAEAILTDEVGIACGSLASWYTANKVLPVVPYEGTDARFPNQENVTSSRYPMPRLYYAYVNRAPGKPLDPPVLEFLRFLLSQEGQNAVADVGMLPGPPEFLTIAIKRLER